MAATIEIVNRALDLLGASSILSMDDASPQAEKMRRLWPHSRDAVLRSHIWKCCRKRVKLPRLAAAPEFGFSFAYELPPDLLRLVGTWPEGVSFQVQGQTLLTNAEKISLDYVRREEDSERFDSLLVEALALKLAADAAFGATASTALADGLEARYRRVLSEAAAADARDGDPNRPPRKGNWVKAKLGR